MLRITAKERVLLHLLDCVSYADEMEVPREMTQEGIARAAWFNLPHFTVYVRPLVEEGLVRERVAHVKGVRQRRKVYDLTEAGRLQAIWLRQKVRNEIVPMRDSEGVREVPLAKVFEEVEGKATLLDVIRQFHLMGTVDLAALRGGPTATFVWMVADAPRLSRFVGRRAELQVLTGDDGGHRVIVVRGVAGIGKTSLAARVCELLRGKRNLLWHKVRPWDTHLTILAAVGDFLFTLGKPGLRAVLGRGELNRAGQVLREDLPGTQSFLVFDDAQETSSEALASFRLLKEVAADVADVRLLVLTRKALPFYDRRDVTLEGLVREIDLAGLASDEVETLLSLVPSTAAQAELCRRLGGHPLFLELVLSSADAAAPAQALRDVHLFIEEEIYRKLSDPEREMMKLASLYRVPVPRESFFAAPSLSDDVLLSLTDRSLIRVVEEGAYEVHDTVQDSFTAMLTPARRRELADFAIGQLQRLADEAWELGDYAACAGYLSNALQMASAERRLVLWERLGDTSERVQDLAATITAYREAMKLVGEGKVLARFHRKSAEALIHQAKMAEAADEIDAGFAALGDVSSHERGWLHLARARHAFARVENEEAREEGASALGIFADFGDLAGQAHALLQLGMVAARTAATSADGVPLAEGYYEAASNLLQEVDDPRFAADFHFSRAYYVGFRSGDVEQQQRHWAALDALAQRIKDPHVSYQLHAGRAAFRFFWLADFAGATADSLEAIHIAEQIRDSAAIANAKFFLASSALAQGRVDQAREAFEESAAEFIRIGPTPLGPLWATVSAGECALMEADASGFKRLRAALLDSGTKGLEDTGSAFPQVLEGFSCLVGGDYKGGQSRFKEAVLAADSRPPASTLYKREAGLVHLYHAAALRAMGQEGEAAAEMERALATWRAYNYRGFLSTAADRERRLVEGLRRILQGRRGRAGALAPLAENQAPSGPTHGQR